MEKHRFIFPYATVLPKIHVMEDHTIPWLRRYHVDAGLMGELARGSVHSSHMMLLERVYQGIPNEVDGYKYIFKEKMLEFAPSLTSLRPKPIRRKKEDSDNEEGGLRQ